MEDLKSAFVATNEAEAFDNVVVMAYDGNDTGIFQVLQRHVEPKEANGFPQDFITQPSGRGRCLNDAFTELDEETLRQLQAAGKVTLTAYMNIKSGLVNRFYFVKVSGIKHRNEQELANSPKTFWPFTLKADRDYLFPRKRNTFDARDVYSMPVSLEGVDRMGKKVFVDVISILSDEDLQKDNELAPKVLAYEEALKKWEAEGKVGSKPVDPVKGGFCVFTFGRYGSLANPILYDVLGKVAKKSQQRLMYLSNI